VVDGVWRQKLRRAHTACTFNSIDSAMPTLILTPAQLAILKVAMVLDGKHRLEGIEGAMKVVSGIPQSEWSPIRSQLESLENLGMVRQVVVDGDKRTFQITERGRTMVK
jgi:hypothetical protein